MSAGAGSRLPPAAPSRPRARDALLQWGLVALALGYTAVVYYGIGPSVGSTAVHWWEPRGFLEGYDAVLLLLESVARALAGFTLPALLLALAVFLAGRSAVACGMAFSCVFACLLFTFYAVQAPEVWRFFSWRGSAVMLVMALALGFSAAAPLLARSWLALGWPARLALYLPVVVLVLAFICNATGTDESLRFAISPWPAVPVFAIEIGSLFIFTGLMGVAIAVTGIDLVRARGGAGAPLLEVAALAAGMLAPIALLALGSSLSLIPFKLGPRIAIAVALLCGGFAAAAAYLPGAPSGLRARVRWIAVGAALIGIPLLSGQAWAYLDYRTARDARAREIIDALQAYYEQEYVYPDELDELVERDLLEAVPEPGIGFDFLYDGHFRYRNFGTSFILEFPAPRWVECAYTPPYEDEDHEDDEPEEARGEDAEPGEAPATRDFAEASDVEDVAAGGDDSLGESWSCPSRPPELW